MLPDIKYFFFLSELLDKKIIRTDNNKSVGRVVDVVVTPKEIYPEVTALIVSPGLLKGLLIIPVDDLEPFALPLTKLYLKPDKIPQLFTPINGNSFLLKDTFLDKQILDTAGCKVVRINDLHLLKENNKIWVVHVDIGFRGIVRRLGWLDWADVLLEWIFSDKLHDRFISWKYVQAIPTAGQVLSAAGQVPASPGQAGGVTLRAAYQCLSKLEPVDMSEILTDLNRNERVATFKLLNPQTAAEALGELVPKIQKELVDNLDNEKRLEIISRMPTDKAVDLINRLSKRKTEEILKSLPRERADEIKALLAHPEQTAGAIMSTDYLALNKNLTVEEALQKLKEISASNRNLYFYYIYVVDDETNFLGVLTFRRLFAGQPTAKLAEVMNPNTIKVKVSARDKKIIDMFLKYNFVTLPVVDAHNKLKGVIFFKDVVNKMSPLFTGR